MMMNKAYQFRIYLNQAQANLINKTIGCSCAVYSIISYIQRNGERFSICDTCAKLSVMKKSFVWLKEVYHIVIQSSVRKRME